MEKRKGEGQEKNDEQALALQESGWCIALVAVKNLLRRIRSCDRVSPSRVTGRILAST